MPVHSLHIFDRKGKTLFTKTYVKVKEPQDAETLSEQRKLVFGMLYSLREIAAALTPQQGNHQIKDLHSVKTGASTLYNYETSSGLRFAMYVTGDAASTTHAASIRAALDYIYNDLYISYVTRSPLYRPKTPNVEETNFEAKLDAYLAQQTWYR
ncbi:hypothetical protein MPSEU_000711200 [Mayamaea pseudoterrestris]|nr:hypothetical protein MPSEU_000711200 [Mayamaea pseudoterrestris]